MSKYRLGFISICLAGCLTFSPAGAGDAHAAASSWVTQRDIVSNSAYSCTVSRRYNGFFKFSMTGGSDGRTSLTFNFENRSFAIGSPYQVRLYTETGLSEVFETTAESANRITVVLGRDSVILSALPGLDVLKADIGDRFRAVNVYSLSPGQEKLETCMALPLDDPGRDVLTPPSAPGKSPPSQQTGSLVKVPAGAPPGTAVPVQPAQPVAQPVRRPGGGDTMTSRIARLMAETEPAPPPSSDLLEPAPGTDGGPAAAGDPYNSRIHDMVKELSGIAPPAPPQPLLEPTPAQQPEPQLPKPQTAKPLTAKPRAEQPQQQPQPPKQAPVQAEKPSPVTAPRPAPVDSAPLTAPAPKVATETPPAQQDVATKAAPPEWGSPPRSAAPAQPEQIQKPEPVAPPPALIITPEPQLETQPETQPAPIKQAEPLTPAPAQSEAQAEAPAKPVAPPPVQQEEPEEIVWAHKRLVPDPPEFILNRKKEEEKTPEEAPGVMLAETRDDVHKPLSMPPELRQQSEVDKQRREEELAKEMDAFTTEPTPSIEEKPDKPGLDPELGLTDEPFLIPEEPAFAPGETEGEMTMEDILNEPIVPQQRSDEEPVPEDAQLPGIKKPTTPNDFVKEMQTDDMLLAQASKIDQSSLTADNTDMEMVSNLLEKMRLLEIEKESLRKELASYQTGPVSEIARIESQARKIYSLKTRLERLGDMNAKLQAELKFNKDRVSDLEGLMVELQAQADEAASLRERVTSLSEQNDALREQVTDLEKEANEARLLRDEDRRRLDELRDIIGSMSSKLDGLSGSGLFDDGLGTDGGGNNGGGQNGGESGDPMEDNLPQESQDGLSTPEIESVDPSEFEGLINP